MNKFWQWMWKCDYAPFFVKWIYNNKNHPDRMAVEPTPQMLIGYKLEYVRDHKYWDGIENYLTSDQMIIGGKLALLWNCKNISKEIDSIIEEFDKETP